MISPETTAYHDGDRASALKAVGTGPDDATAVASDVPAVASDVPAGPALPAVRYGTGPRAEGRACTLLTQARQALQRGRALIATIASAAVRQELIEEGVPPAPRVRNGRHSRSAVDPQDDGMANSGVEASRLEDALQFR